MVYCTPYISIFIRFRPTMNVVSHLSHVDCMWTHYKAVDPLQFNVYITGVS